MALLPTLALAASCLLRPDGVLGRSGDVTKPLPPLPDGVSWAAPQEPDRNSYTSYVHQAVACVGRLSGTDELLVGTGYPESRLHLFAKDGREVVDGVWPRGGWYAHLANVGGRTWGLMRGATEITRTLKGRTAFKVGGAECEDADGIVEDADGWWLRSRVQGWLRYGKDEPMRCLRRHGELRNVTALVLLRGKVYAFCGTRVHEMWIDAKPDEPMLGSGFDGGRAAGRWIGTVDAAETFDGKIRYSFTSEGKSYVLDPQVTEWIHRAKREYPTDEPVTKKPNEAAIGGCCAVADGERIALFAANGRKLQELAEPATLLAAEDEWLVAYVPSKAAILRYRLVEKEAGR